MNAARRRRLAALLTLVAGLASPLQSVPAEEANGGDVEARLQMVRTVELEAAQVARLTGVTALDPRVLEAMRKVPRHLFVPEELRPFAYQPRPLPVWQGQNTAAPFLVALMSHLAGVEPGHVVFETGTGAGYHAAILAELGARVYSKEVIEPLAAEAAATLKRLGYGDRVSVAAGDGYDGWPEVAPFDAIIIKESIDHVPGRLLSQLKPGGRLVIPLGGPEGQLLTVLTATGDGRIERRPVLPVIFSPLQGGERT